MVPTTPKVYLIANTVMRMEHTCDWLKELGGMVCLNHITGSLAESLIELAARRCYRAFDVGLNPNVTKIRKSSEDYHANILTQGHGSVLEHSSATFAIECCSRVFTHELVRHRPGMAYSQESLRYVRLTKLGFEIPEVIANNVNALATFMETIDTLEKAQTRLALAFDIDNIPDFKTKKVLTSTFRRIAPMGLSTGIVMTANFRALRWLIEHRTVAGTVEDEMQRIMGMIADICIHEWPMVFGDFTRLEDGTYVPKYHKV